MAATISDFVRRRLRVSGLLVACSLAGLVALRTYIENHPDVMGKAPWGQTSPVVEILLIVLWVLLLRGILGVFRVPCPRCSWWIGAAWIKARLRRDIGRCPSCHVRFDQPIKP